jgi:hypothetical protein
VRSIEKKKEENLSNISKTIEERISQKLKKISDSANATKKAEEIRIQNLEERKFKQFTTYSSTLDELKEKIKLLKKKEKEKKENVNEKIIHINKSFVIENKNLSKQLMEKYQKISEKNKDKFNNLNEFVHNRHNSIIKVNENSMLNKMFFNSLGENILKNQLKHNSRSAQRNRSNIESRELLQ